MIFFTLPRMSATNLFYDEYFFLYYALPQIKCFLLSLLIVVLLYFVLQFSQGEELKKKLQKIIVLIFIVQVGLFTFIISLISGLNFIPTLIAVALIFEFSLITFVFTLKILEKSIRLNKFYFILGIIFFLIAFLVPLLTEGICICYFQESKNIFKLKSTDNKGFNTYFSRKFTFDKICSNKEPCQVYVTLPKDAMRSVFINVHTQSSIVLPIKLCLIDQTEVDPCFSSKVFLYDDLDDQAQRSHHVFLLDNLKSDTFYQFYIVINEKSSQLYSYKTLPNQLNRELTLVSGGDVGNSLAALQIWKQISKYSLDIMFIGGDIAYDNNILACYWTWDILLKELEKLSQSQGRLIPIVMTIGNHDIGFNAGVNRRLERQEYLAQPIYFSYFPQDVDEYGQITDIKVRKTYFHKEFANIIYFSLDSEYVTQMQDQVQYVNDILENKDKQIIKFAQYHNPIYWGCKGKRMDQIVNDKGVKYWVPLFDKWKFHAAFENHAHMHKRTYFMKNSSVEQTGTLYLGDGAWGSEIYQCKSHPNFVASQFNQYHVWITKISEQTIKHLAIDEKGIIIDEIIQNIY